MLDVRQHICRMVTLNWSHQHYSVGVNVSFTPLKGGLEEVLYYGVGVA